MVNPVSHRLTKQFAQIPKVSHFAAVHIFTHTAREHDAVQLAPVFHRVCQEQMVQIFACEALGQHTHQGVCHPRGHLGQLIAADLLADHPIKARLFGQILTCRVQACEDIFLVHHHQSTPQVNRSGGHQLTVLNQTQLGGATANVDVQDALLVVVTAFGSTRAIHRQHRLHVMACSGADKLAALLCQYGSNRLAVFPAQGFTGQDHRARIHFIRVQTRLLVRLVDDGPQGFGVHQGVA